MNKVELKSPPITVAERLSSLSRAVKFRIEEGIFPGFAVGIHKDGEDAFLYEGKHFPEGNAIVSKDSMFDIASITKLICPTILILMLADRGQIGLDDLVTCYLPKYVGRYKDKVTIRHLLTCSVKPIDTKRYQTKIGSILGNEIIDAIMKTDMEGPPGVAYDYNNWNSIVLGFIVEKVTGLTLEKAFAEYVSKVAGMSDSSYSPETNEHIVPTEFCAWRSPKHVHGSVHDETSWLIKRDTGKNVGAAGIFSNVGDLVNFGKALLQPGKLLSEKALSELFHYKIELKPGYNGSFYGLGVDRVPDDYFCKCFAKNTIFMNGFQSSILMINIEKRLVFAQLSNALYLGRKKDNAAIRELRKLILKKFFFCKHCDE